MYKEYNVSNECIWKGKKKVQEVKSRYIDKADKRLKKNLKNEFIW